MKKLLVMVAAGLLFGSCTKNEMLNYVEPGQESMLYLSLAPDSGTKATGDGHGNQVEDNKIQTLEIFVFRMNEGKDDDGLLDGYRKFTAAELTSLTNLEVQTTTGRKMIYAVANSHKENWKGINSRALFEEEKALLQNDDVRNFIMVGNTEAYLQLASSISISVTRLVARVKVNSVKTSFTGGPYEGMALTDVKAYLTNVQASKFICNGLGDNFAILNNTKYVEADVQGCKMTGMISDDIAAEVGDSGHSDPHYFYCYENSLQRETGGNKFTRLVIEGKLNGTTYYYPIPIKGVTRNNSYSVDVTIKRPGSLDPNTDVEKGTMAVTMAVKDWNIIGNSNVEF